ncbi:TraR/DksA family transcriptional regulator [bacterium]|nr:TraR/DksA family transcriptional regulator [bacterium]
MDKDKLIIFRELLEKRKKEILKEIENQRKSFRREAGLGNMFDQTTDSSYRDEYFQARDNETEMLYQINEALERIESGIYGICEDCREEIPEGRLATKLFARLCVECRRKEEDDEM